MVAAAKTHDSKKESTGAFEIVAQWGLVILAVIASIGALLRIFGPASINVTQGLDQTTLLYLAVAGGLLLFKQIKTFSMGQLKLEMIEKIRDKQDKQDERLSELTLILPLLLQENEVKHIRNLFARATAGYHGTHAMRTELRRLASIGLISRKTSRTIAEMKNDTKFDLGEYVELTDLGRRWAARIQEIEGTCENS